MMKAPRKIHGRTNAEAAFELELALDELVVVFGDAELEGLRARMTPLQCAFVLTCARNLRELTDLMTLHRKASG